MKLKLLALVLVTAGVLVGAHFIFKALPKPNFADRGEATICNPLPEFADFPVTVESGAAAAPVNFLSNSRALVMQAEILAATSSGVNYAGHYHLVEASCGVSCQNHAVVDGKTGDIVEYGMRTTGGVQFKLDSSLLIVNPAGMNITRYYNLQNGVLHYLCEKI